MAPVAVYEDGKEEELSMSALRGWEKNVPRWWMVKAGVEGRVVVGVYGGARGPSLRDIYRP